MSQSGASVSTDAIEAFNQLKLKKTYKWVIFKLSDDKKEIVIEKTSDKDDYDEFRKNLRDEAPRYAIYDIEYSTEDSGIRNKITFISWSSDNAGIRDKMVYSSSKEALRKSFTGIAAEIQANDRDDLEKESVVNKVKAGKA